MTERVVLVTGGNRGIGRSIAEEFLKQGHKVAVTVRSGEGPVGALSVKADVTDAASLDAAFAEIEEKLGPVEILVANAGITRDTLLMRMTDEQFEEVVNTNLNGVFRVLRRASMGMIKKKYGRVILIGSVVGLLGSAGRSITRRPSLHLWEWHDQSLVSSAAETSQQTLLHPASLTQT